MGLRPVGRCDRLEMGALTHFPRFVCVFVFVQGRSRIWSFARPVVFYPKSPLETEQALFSATPRPSSAVQ